MASDVAVPWGIAYFIEYLGPKLLKDAADFLTALEEALNDRGKVADLERLVTWRNTLPAPLDQAWPV